MISIRISDGKIEQRDESGKALFSKELIPPLSPPGACGEGRAELEVLLSNLCHLDQVLGVIQDQVCS